MCRIGDSRNLGLPVKTDDGEPVAVRRPAARVLRSAGSVLVACEQLFAICAVQIDQPETVEIVGLVMVGDLVRSRAKAGIAVESVAVGDTSLMRAVRMHHVQLVAVS